MEIRKPTHAELPALSALCLRSKAWWGYDAAFMALCVPELTLRPGDLSAFPTVAAWDGPAPMGVAQISVEGAAAELEKLFIDPPFMGRGLGRALLTWATGEARAAGARTLRIAADPGAAPFYQRMGARPVGEVASGVIPGRRLPLLTLAL